jgi:molecular chaperone GrpE
VTEKETQDAAVSSNTADTTSVNGDAQTYTQEQYEAAQNQAKEYLEGWQRARAEFTNYKKRVDRELKDSYQNATGDVLKNLLPVIDDFERAFANVPADLKDNPWVNGVTMIQRKFDKLLEQFGVTTVDPTGQPFDPGAHEAVGQDDAGNVPSGHVSATLQKGYMVGDRVLRPALVRVAR